MEDSFKVRVDRAFGALPAAGSSLWSLTDEEIERKEWNRAKKSPVEESDSQLTRRGGGLDDEEEEEDEFGGASRVESRMDAKPDDHDEEEWLIRSSVGMDSTLDKEEEEDEFDLFAVGMDEAGDGDKSVQYVDAIEDVGGDSDRLVEEAVGEIEPVVSCERNGAMILSSKTTSSLCDDSVSVKSILKKDEKNGVSKSLKRVRFDAESGVGGCLEKQAMDRSVKFASGSEVEGSYLPPGTDPRVPDYLRNPGKYTQYTLDTDSELNDEEANKKAYMDFFNLIRTKESQPTVDMSDYSKPLTFIPRKKIGGHDSMDTSDSSKSSSYKESIQCKVASSIVIAAADEVCAMEEDETEMTPVSIPRKAQRQYRAKANLEPLDG